MQALVQMMLHSESGVRIRSHRNKLLTAVPSVFTGKYNVYVQCIRSIVLL